MDNESIVITPDFARMAHQFAHDFKLHGERFLEAEPEALGQFRRFLVSLNIALQCSADIETVLFVRQEVAALAERIVKADDKRLMNEQDDEETRIILRRRREHIEE